MNINRTRRMVEAFNSLDLCDDQLRSIRINPLDTEKNSTIVELELTDDGTGAANWLVFSGCANVRQNTDFDVVADNHFAVMQRVTTSADKKRMKMIFSSHKRHWRTTYMPPRPKDRTVRKKLSSLQSFVLFEIAFHGGTIELLAKSFSLTTQPQLARSKAESR